MRPDGSGAEQITISPSDKRYPVWSQDGDKILFRTNNSEAFAIDLAKGNEERLLKTFGLIGSVAESLDGSELLFVRFRTDLMDDSDIWLKSSEGQERRMLTDDKGLQYDPVWSPDGKKIAYISGHGYQMHDLHIMEANGENKRRLTNDKALELLPAISPDGNTIAYVSDSTGNYEIYLMEVDGDKVIRLTRHDGIDTRPCWSPDGARIMFVSDRSGKLQLWIMGKEGGNPEMLTSGPPSIDPAWRKD